MNSIDFKIGLAFSGGGFRASSFSLGVLSYLNEITFEDTNLLNKVYALSTVSGGTITGARYAVGIKNNESFQDIYKALYYFMSEVDLVNISLTNLVTKRSKTDTREQSIITAFADAYNKYLFSNGKFGTLLDDDNPIHLKHISFNATEFKNALQFRFQKTDSISISAIKESEKSVVGNYYYRITEDIAKEIRLGDILAASSCFPGGFEPIRFPDDFVFDQDVLQNYCFTDDKYPLGLMDGGIVDNQGIEPLLLAEHRMKRKRLLEEGKEDSEHNEFDLLIISDVTSPYMEAYKSSNAGKPNFWRRLNFKRLIISNLLVLIGSMIGLYYSFKNHQQSLNIVFTSLITINLILYLLLAFVKKLPTSFQVPKAFMKPLGKLLKVRFGIYENLILNRSNSLLKMTSEVFLKHIRRLNYNKIYQDKSWRNRRIMNAIYELRHEEERLRKKIKDGKIPENLIPSKLVQEVASKASGMGTTLWFTKEELEKQNMLNSIIACGQFTMCWNLIEYLNKIKKDPENTNQKHHSLFQIENQLIEHWNKFNTDPYWMVNHINKNI